MTKKTPTNPMPNPIRPRSSVGLGVKRATTKNPTAPKMEPTTFWTKNSMERLAIIAARASHGRLVG